MDWSGYHSLAEDLALADCEASHRSAVSRAYYAVLNLSRERYSAYVNEIDFSGKSSHVAVWKALSSHQDEAFKKIAIKGKRLKKLRVFADYEDRERNFSNIAFQSVEQARECIELLDRHYPAN